MKINDAGGGPCSDVVEDEIVEVNACRADRAPSVEKGRPDGKRDSRQASISAGNGSRALLMFKLLNGRPPLLLRESADEQDDTLTVEPLTNPIFPPSFERGESRISRY